MAATVHVGINTNTRYTNNTGTNVRIIIYYLKVSDCTLNNPFYISYGDTNQLAGNGRPSELQLFDVGSNYNSVYGDAFTNWPAPSLTGSGTGLLVDGYIYVNQVNSNHPVLPETGTSSVGYALGDIIGIGDATKGGNNWTTGKARVSDLEGNEAVRVPLSQGFAIGANLASSGYLHYQTASQYVSTSAAAGLQNAAPFGGDGTESLANWGQSKISYAAPTECFISNGQSFELYRTGAASTEMAYNFVAIPEGG